MFPIRGREVGTKDYNQKVKQGDVNKKLYHKALALCVNDLRSYNRLCGVSEKDAFDVLTLEGKDAESAKIMVQECGVKLEHMDLVSKNVEFKVTKKNIKTGDLFTGELFNYLSMRRADTYDVANFDFCGTWATQKYCVRRLFEEHMFDECSFLVVTCSGRGNPGSKSSYQREDEEECIHDVMIWAWSHGYAAHVTHRPFHYGTMYVLFFKVIHLKNTMSYNGGIDCAITAQEWLRTPIDIEVPTPLFNKNQNQKKEKLKIVPTVGKKQKKKKRVLSQN